MALLRMPTLEPVTITRYHVGPPPFPHLIALKLYSFDLPHSCYYILTSNLSLFMSVRDTPEPVASTAFFFLFLYLARLLNFPWDSIDVHQNGQ